MKRRINLRLIILGLLLLLPITSATAMAFDSGSTGIIGTNDLIIPSSPTDVSIVLPPDGVLNYGTVSIPTGVTVTFVKNSANTPVTILASGNVTIDGTIDVRGKSASNEQAGTGGPGGFNGGGGGSAWKSGETGQGPSGGGGGSISATGGTGGGGGFNGSGAGGGLCACWDSSGGNCDSYCQNQSTGRGLGGTSYGNDNLIPLIGGTGGGGAAGVSLSGAGGGGGGGAILIASSGTITVNGSIRADGGSGINFNSFTGSGCSGSSTCMNGSGGGSGGAIRLVADTIVGADTMTISALGGSSSPRASGVYTYRGGAGANGRVHMESRILTLQKNANPPQSMAAATTVYPNPMPSLTISKITMLPGLPGATDIPVPTPTLGSFRTPDITLPFNTPGNLVITVSAQSIPVGPPARTVTVKAVPEKGGGIVTGTGTLAGTDSSSTAQVPLTIVAGTAYILSASVDY